MENKFDEFNISMFHLRAVTILSFVKSLFEVDTHDIIIYFEIFSHSQFCSKKHFF